MANNILGRSYKEIFEPFLYSQVSPPLFSVLSKFILDISGQANDIYNEGNLTFNISNSNNIISKIDKSTKIISLQGNACPIEVCASDLRMYGNNIAYQDSIWSNFFKKNQTKSVEEISKKISHNIKDIIK